MAEGNNNDNLLEAKVLGYEKKIVKLERENRSLNQYNDELRAQVELMNAKLSSINKYLLKSVGVQTEMQIDCQLKIDPKSAGDSQEKPSLQQTKDDLNNFLNNLKADVMQDYIYDATSKTYYSPTTGWYYYPENSAYYNPNDQSYYTYDVQTKAFTLLYSIKPPESEEKESNMKAISKVDNKDDLKQGEATSSEKDEEEGEIIELSDEEDEESWAAPSMFFQSEPVSRKRRSRGERQKSRTKSSLNNVSPIRLIVLKSTTLDPGSLMLVSCLGGKVGQHETCAVFIPDSPVSQVHAEIIYDQHRRVYALQDLSSRNGTFVNTERLKPMSSSVLFHGDIIKFAETELLAHIHPSRDITCDECEPGTAMAKLVTNTSIYKIDDVPVSQRKGLKDLKKKYGLNGDSYRDPSIKLPTGYKDRAGKRQREVGSDNPYEKTAAGSALDMPLDQRNVGFKMMEKMGWKNGEAVGADKEANTEPIDIEMRDGRTGLGYGSRR